MVSHSSVELEYRVLTQLVWNSVDIIHQLLYKLEFSVTVLAKLWFYVILMLLKGSQQKLVLIIFF